MRGEVAQPIQSRTIHDSSCQCSAGLPSSFVLDFDPRLLRINAHDSFVPPTVTVLPASSSEGFSVMSKQRRSLSRLMKRFAFIVAFLGLTVAGVWGYLEYTKPPRPSLTNLTLVSARRADVNPVLRAPGKTASENSTLIDAKIERLASTSEGRVGYSSGATTILWVIDDGTFVKKNDLLCSLDSSEYEELVRQQQIRVDRARADLERAKLDFETSQMGVAQFRDGLMIQTQQENEGRLKLAESNRVRATARLAWTERMRSKGYASLDQIATDRLTVKRCDQEILKAKWDMENFVKFGAPIEMKALNAAVESARATLIANQMRYDRFLERFEYYKQMVDYCTIRAPHDGYLIYANNTQYFSSTAPVEAGSSVRQGQQLFYLPDLSRMKVIVKLHESVMAKVKPGMKVSAKIPGLSNRELEGTVVKIDPMPDGENTWLSDKRSFNATIHINNPPSQIRPEMSAEVAIDLSTHPDVIAIPPEALAVEDGADFCYVASADGQLERRHITLGESDFDSLEVIEGLDEGEQVVSDVSHIEDYAALVVDAKDDVVHANSQAASNTVHTADEHAVAASHTGEHSHTHKTGL